MCKRLYFLAGIFGFLLLTLLHPLCASATIALGIDVLQQEKFAPIAGKRIGLVANQTSVNAAGHLDREILFHAPNVKLVALFSPEHGIDGTAIAGKAVANCTDRLTKLPVYSLHGATRKPTSQMLRGLDALVFDLQDVGCRGYTYISTMAKCMEAAGENHIEFIVLDRPNPLGGQRVEGPGIEAQWISFVGQLPVPYVHGMTIGELAKMINANHWVGAQCKLTVIPMHGWKRDMTWQETGLRWIRSSPNIPYAISPFYYVATGIVSNLGGLDNGIGSSVPFQRIAAPYVNAQTLVQKLRSLNLPGVQFEPCHTSDGNGVNILINPHANANLCALNVYLAYELCHCGGSEKLFRSVAHDPDQIFYKIYGSKLLQTQLLTNVAVNHIIEGWRPFVEQFRRQRSAYLLY